MAKPQVKKRFSFFSSTQKSPPLSPQNLYNNTSSYFLSQEIRDDNNPTTDDLRISIENLEKLVLAADEYRDCVNKLSKISKNFSKCLKDYSNCKGIDKSYVQCIQFTSQFYEHHAEIQVKLDKALQKEFETLQKFWDRYSKKVEKDEKAHNDYVGDLDKQIKKISKDHEKKSKKENKYALESHDKYIASLTSIGSDIARARTEYAEEVMKREKHTHSVISQVVCRFIEGQFASFNDSLKKCGPSITKVKEWASFAGQDTCIPSQLDLDSFLEMQTKSDISNDELVSSEKQPRKSPNKISQSIASISELQKAVMNNKLQETEPLTEECEKIEENLSPQTPITSISEKPSEDHDFSISVETTTTTVVTNVNKNAKNRSTIPSVPPIVTATTVINPPISSTNVPNSKEKPSSTKNKPLTPNLLSSLSIGIHDGDNPFFRDDGSKKITEMTDLMEDEETKQIKTIMMIDNQGSSINNDEKESSTKLEENNIVSLTPPPIYDRSRDITKNDRWSSKKDQLKNEDEINSFPVKNTFRLSFIENNPENGVNNDDESRDIDDKRIVNEKEIRPTSSLSSFETERLVNSFPIDLPIRSIPQNCQQKSGFCEDNSERYNCDHDQITNNNKETILHRHSDSLRNDVEKRREPENKGMRDESYVTYPPTHSTKQQRQYNINPRRAYTEYPLPNRLSVADIRDRLLSSLNANEKILSTRSTHDLPKPKQGYVNEVKSKFGGMNNSRNNDNITVIPGSTSFRDDMYLNQIECSKEINSESSSRSIVNEQCNCHNCQEIRRVMNMNDARNRNHHLKDSFLSDDDLTTFGRNNY